MATPAKKAKKEPKLEHFEAETNGVIAMIRNDLDEYDKKRVKAISDVVITFFKRHPNKFYTRFCFTEQLDGFEPGQRKRLKANGFTCVKPWQTNFNKDLDLKQKWDELHPTDLEEKMVWSALEQNSFLRKSQNENYDPNIRNPFGHELSEVAPEGNRWLWIHVPDITEILANWTW